MIFAIYNSVKMHFSDLAGGDLKYILFRLLAGYSIYQFVSADIRLGFARLPVEILDDFRQHESLIDGIN